MHQLVKVGLEISEEKAAIPPVPPGPELILNTDVSRMHLEGTLVLFMVLVTASLAILLKMNKYLKTVTELIPESGMMLFFGAIVALIFGSVDKIAREVSGDEEFVISPIQISPYYSPCLLRVVSPSLLRSD